MRLLVAHTGAAIRLLASLCGSLLTFVLGDAAADLAGCLIQLSSFLVLSLLFYCVFMVSRKKSPAPLLRLLSRLAYRGFLGLWKLSAFLLKLLRRIAEGTPTRKEPK
ncbi:MAG TPA: hypothetical protein VHE55_09940 [Fimbriimonadaceae bacterium]|nr:hypothetical protein [Fimbriimonadaceae bacterium]